MTQTIVRQQFTQKPDPQLKPLPGSDITPHQEQEVHTKLPHSLAEWLAQINQRYQAIQQNQTQQIG